MKDCEGKTVSVEVKESKDGQFQNIREFYGVVHEIPDERERDYEGGEEQREADKKFPETAHKPTGPDERAYKNAITSVMCATDLVCAGKASLSDIEQCSEEIHREIEKIAKK